MAAGTQRAQLPQDRVIIHGSLDILGSFPDESLQGLRRTQQASRTQSSSNRPHAAVGPRGRGGFGASTKDVGYATRYVQRHSKRDSRTQKRALAQAGMAVVTRRNPSGTDEEGAVMRPGKGGIDDSEEDKHGSYSHVPERTSADHQATRQSDASGYVKQPSETWSFRPGAVRHTLPQGCYDVRAEGRASSGYDTAYHGYGNPIGFNENSRAGRSPNTRPGNDEQRCWKGPECYHRGPENSSSASDDGHHCRVDGDDDGLPFDAIEGYGEGYSGEAEIHRGRLAKCPELRQRCRRSTELGPARCCCDLQEAMIGQCCAGRRPRRRSIRDEGDCVGTWRDGSRGKEERDIPSTRRKQSPHRRYWSPEERTLAVPTGRRLWTRGDEEDKKKPRPQILNEALVQRPSDMLLFSKKARPVEYKPCTLKEYRETKPTAYMELGKLQPDLHTEELVAKRANAERVKEFSEKLRQINSDATARRRKSHTAPTKPAVQDARSRALAFARQIPPPRPIKAKPLTKGRDDDELSKTGH